MYISPYKRHNQKARVYGVCWNILRVSWKYLGGYLKSSWVLLGGILGVATSFGTPCNISATPHYHLNNAAATSNQHPYPQETTRRSQDNQRIPSGYPRIPEVWCELVGSGGVLARAG